MGASVHQSLWYAPYALKICLNGHEWVKRQLPQHRLPFTALDNGILACPDPAGLQAVCDRLTDADIEAFFTRWVGRPPLPLTAAHREAGFSYLLSMFVARALGHRAALGVASRRDHLARRRSLELFLGGLRRHAPGRRLPATCHAARNAAKRMPSRGPRRPPWRSV